MVKDVWHQLHARKIREWSIIKLYILCFVLLTKNYVIASSKGRFHFMIRSKKFVRYFCITSHTKWIIIFYLLREKIFVY